MPIKNKPIKKASEIQENPDEHIDQDFPGFPHLPATQKNINPETTIEKKTAAATKKRSKKTYG
ncbi:MAG: hypothetical protein WBC06_14525 [Chitinophagaceae bacterium]